MENVDGPAAAVVADGLQLLSSAETVILPLPPPEPPSSEPQALSTTRSGATAANTPSERNEMGECSTGPPRKKFGEPNLKDCASRVAVRPRLRRSCDDSVPRHGTRRDSGIRSLIFPAMVTGTGGLTC